MKIYRSNTYSKDLSWLHFDNEPRVQERQPVKDQQLHVSVFVAYLFQAATRNTNPDVTTVVHEELYGTFTEIQSNLYRTNQGSNFLRVSFSNRDTVRAPIQYRKESQPHHLKRSFFLKNKPIHFYIISSSVVRPVK